MLNFNKLSYTDFLKLEPTFISLDISIKSTGWVKSENGVVSWGTKSLTSIEDVDRRKEFREFLIDLCKDVYFPVVFIEDVIAGTNFKTTKGLILLNSIMDDLKEYNLVNVGTIKRIDNKKWKKYLKDASNYIGEIKKEDDKILIVNCLHSLGFSFAVKQDIYDAMGMAISIIYRDNILKEKSKTNQILKKDLRTGFTIKQFELDDIKLSKSIDTLVKKYNREVEVLNWVDESRDILYLFKQKVSKDSVDNKIYVITLTNMKLGALALTKKLTSTSTISVLVVTRTKG